MRDRSTLAAALEHAVAEHTHWDRQLVQDIHTLSSAGVQSIEQLLDATRTKVRPAADLAAMLGARTIRAKQIAAWNRISHLLTTGTNTRDGHRDTAAGMPHANRHLHASIKEALHTLWPANPTAKPHTIVHMLADLQHSNRDRIHSIRSKMTLTVEERMHMRRHTVLASSARNNEALIMQPTARTHNTRSTAKTGYEKVQEKMTQHRAACGADKERLQQELLGLQEQYSLKPETIISVDTGGPMRVKLNTPQPSTQLQVKVKWGESV